jgi:hypothetical protein
VPTGGIDRKWAALSDEREALRTERDELQREVGRLLAEKKGMEALEKYGLNFDAEEQSVNDALRFVSQTIVEDWGLEANGPEFVAAVHVIQSFIVQHMLARLAPERWSGWWRRPDNEEDEKGKSQ